MVQELKAFIVLYNGKFIRVYPENKVNNVLAEKDAEIADLTDKLQKEYGLVKETRDCLIESQKMHKRCADNAIKVIRHNKYKRCLGLASGCRLRARWFGDNAFYKKEQWALQWRKRWLALAEKFKERSDEA